VKVSLVIPAYNEAGRLPGSLRAIADYLSRQSWDAELLIVDDGSTDETVRCAEAAWGSFPGEKRMLRNNRNRGKGFSVRRGMLESTGDYIFFTDADLSTPIEEIDPFLKRLEADRDVVIGSRDLPDSAIELHQSWLREHMGKAFNRMARLFSFKGVLDSQCGFKGFRKEAAQRLFRLQKIDGFSFDAEIIHLAQRLGYRLEEMPVTWRNSPVSRVSIWRDPVKMLFDIMWIPILHRNLEAHS